MVRRIFSKFTRSMSFVVSVLFHYMVSKSFVMVLVYGVQVLIAWKAQDHVVICWSILISRLVVGRFQAYLAIWHILIVLRLLIAVGCILIVLGFPITLWLRVIFPFVVIGCHIW